MIYTGESIYESRCFNCRTTELSTDAQPGNSLQIQAMAAGSVVKKSVSNGCRKKASTFATDDDVQRVNICKIK